MADFEEIIHQSVDDVWRHMNCANSSSLEKEQVKNFVCTMNAHNEHIDADFEHAFAQFGKGDSDAMTRDELV